MERKAVKSLLLVAALAAAGCESGRHSASGFRLPPDGDIERGKVAFVALGCAACHEVSGGDMPRPTVQPPVPVVLGGVLDHEMSDGRLVTSIIYPTFRLAHYPKSQLVNGGQSRMPPYADQITVRQLTDIVAFLQSRYGVRRIPTKYYF